jgi:hypothetical protein
MWQIWRTRRLRRHGNALFLQKFTNWQRCVCGLLVVTKLEGSSRLQFPFELESPSFSDGPGHQDNIFDSLWHQVVQILYEVLGANEKEKRWSFSGVFICSCEISSVLETVECAIPHSVSWFQGRIRKTNFHHLLWPDKENLVHFRAFKHFCWHFVSTRFSIIIQICWNHSCTQFFHFQILCNNMLDRTFINIKLIGDNSNCQNFDLDE